MKYFRIFMAGVFAFTCSGTTVAETNEPLSKLVPGSCQIMPLVDDVNKLNLEDPEFEIKLLEALTQRDRKGRYYIANSECKDEIVHFLNRACDNNDRKPQVVCEMTYLLTQRGTILEKYKSLSPHQQKQVQSYFNELYMDIFSKDDETVLDIAKIDEEKLKPTIEESEESTFSGIGFILLGSLFSGGSGFAVWHIISEYGFNPSLSISLLSIMSLVGVFMLVAAPAQISQARKELKKAKLELKKIHSNTGLRTSEMALLIESFIENTELEYAHGNGNEKCIRVLE